MKIFTIYHYDMEHKVIPHLYAYSLDVDLAKTFMTQRNPSNFKMMEHNASKEEIDRFRARHGPQRLKTASYIIKDIDDLGNYLDREVEFVTTADEEVMVVARGKPAILKDIAKLGTSKIEYLLNFLEDPVLELVEWLIKIYSIPYLVRYAGYLDDVSTYPLPNEKQLIDAKESIPVDEIEIFGKILGGTLNMKYFKED